MSKGISSRLIEWLPVYSHEKTFILDEKPRASWFDLPRRHEKCIGLGDVGSPEVVRSFLTEDLLMLVGFNVTSAQSLRKGRVSRLQIEALEEGVVLRRRFSVLRPWSRSSTRQCRRTCKASTGSGKLSVSAQTCSARSATAILSLPISWVRWVRPTMHFQIGPSLVRIRRLRTPWPTSCEGVDAENNNSFSHASVATYGGWTSTSLLTPRLRGVNVGLPGDAALSPLLAEIQETRPAIALVMIGTCEVGFDATQTYEENLTTITQYLLSQGVIPVLSTIPDIKLSPDPALVTQVEQYNQIIADVAVRKQRSPLEPIGRAQFTAEPGTWHR